MAKVVGAAARRFHPVDRSGRSWRRVIVGVGPGSAPQVAAAAICGRKGTGRPRRNGIGPSLRNAELTLVRTLLSRLSETPVAPSFASAPASDGREERQIGKAVGLTQFGVNHLTLNPGATSSRRHWHEGEDEFVLVLAGCVTLVDENGDHDLVEGDFAGFPAGAANGHHLVNRSASPTILLVVGARKVGEERVHYPDQPDPGPFTVVRDEKGARIG